MFTFVISGLPYVDIFALSNKTIVFTPYSQHFNTMPDDYHPFMPVSHRNRGDIKFAEGILYNTLNFNMSLLSFEQ
jgi:hypothetical protein